MLISWYDSPLHKLYYWTGVVVVDTLVTMQKLIIVAGLMVLAGACGPGAGGPRTPQHPGAGLIVKPPARVGPENYPGLREKFDSLPLTTRGRQQFRQALLGYLVQQATAQLDQEKEDSGHLSFKRAVSLFDPREVHTLRLSHPGLARLAGRVVAIFSPRGDLQSVMLGLCVGMSLGARPEPLQQEYRRMTGWINETEVQLQGRILRGRGVGRLLERTAAAWPSPFVVDELLKNRLQRIEVLAREARIDSSMRVQTSYPELFLSGLSIVRTFVRVGRFGEALKRLNSLPSRHARDETLRSLLERVVSPSSRVGDHLDLARYFKPHAPAVALLVCQVARDRFPQKAEGHACVGLMAHAVNKMLLARKSLAQAVALAPKNRTYARSLAEAYRYHFTRLILRRRHAEARGALQGVRNFYLAHGKRFKGLSPADNRFYFRMGEEFFDRGLIDLATDTYAVSLAVRHSPEAAVKLGTIMVNRAPSRALEFLSLVERPSLAAAPHASSRSFWQARFASLRGRAYARAGETARSHATHKRAIATWKAVRAMDKSPKNRADTFIYEAKSQFALGAREAALRALGQAMAVKPLRRAAYLDAIALLTTHDQLPEALTAYHRLMKHHGVSEYHRTYCSFWIVVLARRAGRSPDPLALEFLRKLSSKTWYTRLSRLILGQVSYDQLAREARTIGDRAELYFYQAELLLAQGKKQQARRMWKQVLKTEMMGFYEYEMAGFKLRRKTGSKP